MESLYPRGDKFDKFRGMEDLGHYSIRVKFHRNGNIPFLGQEAEYIDRLVECQKSEKDNYIKA